MTASQAAHLMAARQPHETLCGKPRQFVYAVRQDDGELRFIPPPLSSDPYDTDHIMRALGGDDGC